MLKSAVNSMPVGIKPQRVQLSEKVLSQKYSVMRGISESILSMTTVRKVLYLLLLIKTYGIECSLEPGRLKMHPPETKQK